MPTLSYGLNIPKKAQSGPQKPKPAKPKALFDDDSDQDEPDDNRPEAIETFSASSKPSRSSEPQSAKTSKPAKRAQPDIRYGDLATSHSAAKHAASAQEVDPSVYDYDGVYDSLHAKPIAKKAAVGPKYMQNLLESAELRKRDQLRAKEKMLAKEREAEGDEFADKERFVTAAYREQQEEMRRLEAAEREREEQAAERGKREGGGMRGLYKDILAREDARHEAIAQALEEGPKGEEDHNFEREELKLAQEKGATVNEEGQVVDKRQLLQAGINLGAKPKGSQQPTKADVPTSSSSMNNLQGRGGQKAAMRERQTRMLEQQLEQQAKRAAEDEAAEQAAVQRAAKSQKTEGDISSARERYMQRKKEREAEAAKAAGTAP